MCSGEVALLAYVWLAVGVSFSLVVAVAVIGAGVGFLSGMFGKGGSAVATPLLSAAGVPAVMAVASPLPATIPTTLAAARTYWRGGWLERRVLERTLLFGVPATIVGAVVTHWVDGSVLVLVTDVLIAGIGLRVVLGREQQPDTAPEPSMNAAAVIGTLVGFSAGLLANSGGALLAPLYLTVLHLPIKRTFATSLTAATVLAIPATIIHAGLGHIDWWIVLVFGLTSVPFSIGGARVALRTRSDRLERLYGVTLLILGVAFVVEWFL